MNLYEAFERDISDAAKTFPLGDEESITMIPAGGDTARRAFETLMEPYAARLNAGGKLTEKENKKLNARFYSETIVKGWKGLTGKDNEAIPYSKEAAFALFTDDKLAGFFALIIRISQDDSAFKAQADASDEGNS